MKRTFCISILLSTFFLFSACGGNNKDETEVPESNESSSIKELSYKGFTKKIWDIEAFPDSVTVENDRPCVVKFYADWCGPCRTISPIIDSLAEINDDVCFFKVNVDKEKKLAYILDIQNIPTVMYFPLNGQPSVRIGAMSAETYASDIEKLTK